jgi:hypothetical protein
MTGVELAEIALSVIECPDCRHLPTYCDSCREELKTLIDNDPELACCDYGFSDDPIDKS